MKIFVVYARVVLDHPPEWLDAFRKKYDEAFEYHITLKQPAWVEESEVTEIKKRLLDFFAGVPVPKHSITVRFDRLMVDDDGSEGTIMLRTENEILPTLQRGIVNTLQNFSNYYEPKTEEYEKNFQPHITIGRDLPLKLFEKAQSELPLNPACSGIISEVVLAVVPTFGPEEASKPHNQTVYTL